MRREGKHPRQHPENKKGAILPARRMPLYEKGRILSGIRISDYEKKGRYIVRQVAAFYGIS